MANIEQIKKSMISGALDESFETIYVKEQIKSQYPRYEAVIDSFAQYFDNDKTREISLFSAPGRSEVSGNHTDHNHGKVLAASISLDAIAAACKNDDGIVRIKSAGYNMDVVDCGELEIVEKEIGKSNSLVRGVIARFKQLGYNIGGFDATTASQVLSGSGLSSSAAFEVLVCTMLNHFYNDGKIDPVEIAQISQYAENVYFGKPCGLLDQMACSVGGFVTIDFEDPSKPIINKIDFDFAHSGHSLCIVDTKGSHSDLTDEYVAVRREMEKVAEHFDKTVLREITKDMVMENMGEIIKAHGERAAMRALHFFNDNARVEKQVAALAQGDFETFKTCVIESGFSSYMYNQNVYTCKKPTNQPVSLALAVSEEILKGKGAWRVHGGGFAGTIQAFVPQESLEVYIKTMQSIYGDDSCYVLNVRPFGGVRLK
ncbi:MAG: galactokinase family protein [Clostridia bacterium]